MNGEERRNKIIKVIQSGGHPVSGSSLSEMFDVSRQVIVQDIALLRAAGFPIVSTNRGYLCRSDSGASRVFKVCHANEDIVDELYAIVDLGGRVMDVFVNHKVYGKLQADLDIGEAIIQVVCEVGGVEQAKRLLDELTRQGYQVFTSQI